MSSHKKFGLIQLPLEMIEEATNYFSEDNLIGQGGFGNVYIGSVFSGGIEAKLVARRLHYDYGQGDLEFWHEIALFDRLYLMHENIVLFIGFCDEKGEKIMVYDYAANGSLDKYLSSSSTLTWMQRLNICVDVARALNYIHCDDELDFSLIHRNIKSSKILLDKNWKPKLTGFGHYKLNTKARRHRLVLADIVGTIGYVDPTYEKTGFVTHKSDVYSFGVVLFEVLCGRRAFDPDKTDQQYFTKQDIKNEKLDELPLPTSLPTDPHSISGIEMNSSFVDRTRNSSRCGISMMIDLDDFDDKPSNEHHSPTSLPVGTPRISGIEMNSSFEDPTPNSFGSGVTMITEPSKVRPLLHSTSLPVGPPSINRANEMMNSSFVDRLPNSFVSYRASIANDRESPTISNVASKTSETADHVLMIKKSYNSDEKDFKLQPLFTMKGLDRYMHSPNEELLAHLAKSHYDEGNLEDLIDPDLRKQMDQESFKIFSETAYHCLKEKRAQRPTIDQILRNLEKALYIQEKRENPEESKVAPEVDITISNRLKGQHLEHLRISHADIKAATKNFTQTYLGSGAFATVYRAELEVSIKEKTTGEIARRWRTVAIKCINKEVEHAKQGFDAEIELLTNCNHPNIVALLGFCDEGSNMILVYEHASNRSVADYLGTTNTNSSTNLTWMQRIKIAIEIAHGLNYIHNLVDDEQKKIIHRDIKSENILLGKNWTAKIADFGLSRFYVADNKGKTVITMNIAGTEYYMCPEYKNGGKLKTAVDIYSFGVVLFEILSGKLAYDSIYFEGNNIEGIADVARRRFNDGTIYEMVDPKIMEEVDELTSTPYKGPNKDSLKTYLEIAHRCVAVTQRDRPTAKQIIDELLKASSLQENNKDNLQMSFEEIRLATKNFSRENRIGLGGFGNVFTGEVTRGNGSTTIVAKRLDRSGHQGEHHFLMELEILFEYKHENIIGLEGYCNEKEEKIIVYEHASRISLDKHLNDKELTWTKRLKICIDIARGLAFLHGGSQLKEMVIHRDIKSANILLNDDWKAKISDFGLSAITGINQEVVSKLVGTDGYVDPQYEDTGFFTEKSDIYSFGVVLFEILYGKLLVPKKDYDKQVVASILAHIHGTQELIGSIVFEGIEKQIDPESLYTFRVILSKCLAHEREERPTAKEVLHQLEKSLEFQEDYEVWMPKLPKDYLEILKLSKSSGINSTDKKKELYLKFREGILLQDEKVCFSLGSNGERNEMISATTFSYRNRCPHDMWCSNVPESRFQKVAKLFDISNLMIKIKTRSHLLSPNTIYGVHLVFKFCDPKMVSRYPMYVDLKYRKGSKSLHAYFAKWRDDDKWMMIELYRFLNQKENVIFKFLLESLSPHYSIDPDDAIYVQGIEFRAINDINVVVAHYETQNPKEIKQVMKSNLNVGQVQLPTESEEIFKRSENYDDSGKLFSVSEVNGKKHLMISAKAALHNSSNLKLFKTLADSRFQEVLELLPQPIFRISCRIKIQMLSQDTKYMCYLVFKISEKCHGLHGPVEVRDLLHEKKGPEIVYLISPRPWNIHDITQVPKQRKDGWMEVNVWEFNSDHHQLIKNDCILVNLKLISYKGSMSGLIVCGLEFRPI